MKVSRNYTRKIKHWHYKKFRFAKKIENLLKWILFISMCTSQWANSPKKQSNLTNETVILSAELT